MVIFAGRLCRFLVLYTLPRAVWYFPGTRGVDEVEPGVGIRDRVPGIPQSRSRKSGTGTGTGTYFKIRDWDRDSNSKFAGSGTGTGTEI